MITSSTRSLIKGYLEGFLQELVAEKIDNEFNPKELRPSRSYSSRGDLKPFHESLLPDGLLTISEFERSFSTKLGTTFEECAKFIARDNHAIAKRGRRVKGEISLQAVTRIEEIISEIGNGGMDTGFQRYVDEIVDLAGQRERTERQNIVDLYVLTKDSSEMFFEIKSPKPNKGQCLEATGRLLQIHGITHGSRNDVRTYFACAYNPWGIEKHTYEHSFTRQYMDMDEEVLIGHEFWDLIGGRGTYQEVLEIYQEVGLEKGSDIVDQLALGY